jgi:hypothetical protein
MDATEKKLMDSTRRQREAEGFLAFSVDCFGDHIAKREKYKSHRGLDAVHFYLVGKYGWLPAQVRALNWDDLRFLLEEEMVGWTLPKELRHDTAAPDGERPTLGELAAQATPRRSDAASKPKRPERQRVSELKT